MNPAVIILLTFISLSNADSQSDCGWTECQQTNWAVKGCAHLGQVSTKEVDCSGGKRYYCCSKQDLSETDTVPIHHVPGYQPLYKNDNIAVDYYFGKTLVVFKTLKLNWMLAHLKCKRHGMRLVTFSTPEEFAYQSEVLRNNMVNAPDRQSWAWVGASDLFNEGHFTWLETGRPLSSKFYNIAVQPDNYGGNEDCVEFRKEFAVKYFHMNDQPCKDDNGVFCEH